MKEKMITRTVTTYIINLAAVDGNGKIVEPEKINKSIEMESLPSQQLLNELSAEEGKTVFVMNTEVKDVKYALEISKFMAMAHVVE